jgi:hypothetical protein
VPRYTANHVVSRRDEVDGTLFYNPDVDDVAVINGSGIAVFAYLAEPRTSQTPTTASTPSRRRRPAPYTPEAKRSDSRGACRTIRASRGPVDPQDWRAHGTAR